MATFRLVNRKTNQSSDKFSVEDGDQDSVLLVDFCEQCGKLYGVHKTTDRFCSPKCQVEFKSLKRPRKTQRRRAS